MEIQEFLITWVPVFVILSIVVIGLLKFAGIRSKYKIQEVRQDKQLRKESETFTGAINDMIDSAPKNLEQIESELATIRHEASKNGTTPEQLKQLTSRLESERDLLRFASKYGKVFKPLGSTVGTLLE